MLLGARLQRLEGLGQGPCRHHKMKTIQNVDQGVIVGLSPAFSV